MKVFCRIGSSERNGRRPDMKEIVFCRIGSSEMMEHYRANDKKVFCRIGSSEMHVMRAEHVFDRFLPDRQLRNG